MNVDLRTLRPTGRIEGEDEEDTRLIQSMLHEASRFLGSFSWVGDILESYYGIAVGGIVAVFLFHVVPARDGVDEWLWVVVGDLPPAYLVTDDAPTPASALRAYIDEMARWVEAVRAGSSLDDVIPVNAPADLEHAAMLASRLAFLEAKVVNEASPP